MELIRLWCMSACDPKESLVKVSKTKCSQVNIRQKCPRIRANDEFRISNFASAQISPKIQYDTNLYCSPPQVYNLVDASNCPAAGKSIDSFRD